MADISEIVTETIAREVDCAEITVDKVKGGFEVVVKSRPIAEFFASLALRMGNGEPATAPSGFPGINIYQLDKARIPNLGSDSSLALASSRFFEGSVFNATFLRSPALAEGLKVREELGNVPPNNNHGRSIGVALKAVTRRLYTAYIAPFHMEIRLTSRETVIE